MDTTTETDPTTHTIEINGVPSEIEIYLNSANGPKVTYSRTLVDDDQAVDAVDEICADAGFRVDWSSEVASGLSRMCSPLVAR